MSLAVKLAIASAIIAGFGMPFLKVSQRLGVNASEILIFNGIACLFLGIITSFIFTHSTTGFHWKGILAGLLTTLFLNLGFYASNYSFSHGGSVSVIYAITPASTLITVFIGLTFLNEAGKIVMSRFIPAVFGLLICLYFIVTSIKTD